MNYSDQRCEPRFPLGARLTVSLNREGRWIEFGAFTVNVSDNGLLVTLAEEPETGERARIKLPDGSSFEGEAEVMHVIPGNANYLVGMRLRSRTGAWLTSNNSA